MVKRLKQKNLVAPSDVKPSFDGLDVAGVFNPAAARVGDEIYLLARVAETRADVKEGYFCSPRYVFDSPAPGIEIDEFPIKFSHDGDVRKYEDSDGNMRLAFISHLRLIKLDSTGFNVKFIDERPTFYPEFEHEEYGVEDPRLTYIEGRYFFTYVSVSKQSGVTTSLASTADFRDFTRHGVIFCQENKDVVLLPGKFDGKYCAYHRPIGKQNFSPPNIQAAFSPDLVHWGRHKVIMTTRPNYWDTDRIGGGTVPIRTEKGWLEIYHGVKRRDSRDPVGVYAAGAALFDLQDPTRLIARCKNPILAPEKPGEVEGFVNNVIFPTAALPDESGENIIIFSGGADKFVTAILVSLKEIMDSMEFYF